MSAGHIAIRWYHRAIGHADALAGRTFAACGSLLSAIDVAWRQHADLLDDHL